MPPRNPPHLPPGQFLCCRSLRPISPLTVPSHLLFWPLLRELGGQDVESKGDPLGFNEIWTQYSYVIGVLVRNPYHRRDRESVQIIEDSVGNKEGIEKMGVYMKIYGVNSVWSELGGKQINTITHLTAPSSCRPPILTPFDAQLTPLPCLIRLNAGVDFNCKTHGHWRYTVFELLFQPARTPAEILALGRGLEQKARAKRGLFGRSVEGMIDDETLALRRMEAEKGRGEARRVAEVVARTKLPPMKNSNMQLPKKKPATPKTATPKQSDAARVSADVGGALRGSVGLGGAVRGPGGQFVGQAGGLGRAEKEIERARRKSLNHVERIEMPPIPDFRNQVAQNGQNVVGNVGKVPDSGYGSER